MTAADRGDEMDARIEAECARTGHLPWDPDTDPAACACGEVPPSGDEDFPVAVGDEVEVDRIVRADGEAKSFLWVTVTCTVLAVASDGAICVTDADGLIALALPDDVMAHRPATPPTGEAP